MTALPQQATKKKFKHAENTSLFIQKSFELLEDQKFTDIVDWNAEGTALVIKKPLDFGQIVLPTYFKHNNLTSFVRQLNMYNFHKRRTQAFDHVYYHDLFQRGRKYLLKDIKRKNQESSVANIQKAIEALEKVQYGEHVEINTNNYENQLLKKINKDSFSKIETLENKVKELNAQNQFLLSQMNHQSKKENVLVSFIANFMKKRGITLERLPETLNNQFRQPMIESSVQDGRYMMNPFVQQNMANYIDFSDDNGSSTEDSTNSPVYYNRTVSGQMTPYSNDIWQSNEYPSVLTKRDLDEKTDGDENITKMIKKDNVRNIVKIQNPGRININISKTGSLQTRQHDCYSPVSSFQDIPDLSYDRMDLSIFD